ncbi:MAG: UbiA family prenyltransferase [Sphingobacteriaceae bacterium]|nr:UbiA family prenyltransferase [Sphingobacteriaceae bacterium]
MIWKSPAFRHLRLPFSWFLLPAFLMGMLAVPEVDFSKTLLLFVVLHFLVYPSSNAFNSLQDQDEGPIGGMEHPPKAPASLRYISLGFDALALLFGFWQHWALGLGLLAYILASRAYSYRPIRLKKHPWTGFFTVLLFQGPWVMLLAALFTTPVFGWENATTPGLLYVAAALVLGGSYPLTQIYQHEADRNDGVLSLSAWLGIQGTFKFCAVAFALGGPALLFPLWQADRIAALLLLTTALLPVLLYFFWWWQQTTKDPAAANFKNTMRMNLLASSSLNLALGLILVLNL